MRDQAGHKPRVQGPRRTLIELQKRYKGSVMQQELHDHIMDNIDKIERHYHDASRSPGRQTNQSKSIGDNSSPGTTH